MSSHCPGLGFKIFMGQILSQGLGGTENGNIVGRINPPSLKDADTLILQKQIMYGEYGPWNGEVEIIWVGLV